MPQQRPRLLVVDDDPARLTLIGDMANAEGFDVTTAVAADALGELRSTAFDLAVIDLRVPQESLRRLLAGIHAEGAQRRLAPMDGDAREPLDCGEMIGRGPAMRDVFDLIRRLAPHARTALITGETGTGKELAARALHELGPRSGRPLVAVNCSVLVDTTFESELFGHVRGAFTGATEDKPGLFESADGGTLLLDEVGELSLQIQAKLLRAIEHGEVQRVGSLERRRVDVRLIAVTNRDLRAEVAAGRFRKDLFYRLNLAEIRVPALRDRREDVPYLIAAFVRTFSHRFNRPVAGLTQGAERVLATAPWEGNVRQLRNVVERACMLATGEWITEADVAGVMEDGAAPYAADASRRRSPAPLADIAREHIVRTLEQVSGNKAVAARLLGVSRRAFYRQLERHGLHKRVPASRMPSVAVNTVERVS